MSSLSARLLVSVSLLLLIFFGVTIVVLDVAFRTASEQAQKDILDSQLMSLLAAAEPTDGGVLGMPPDLPEPRFGTIGSGLYAEVTGADGASIWRSRSALGLELPAIVPAAGGAQKFAEAALQDGTPLLTLSLAVQWEFPDGQLRPYVFKVAESLDAFNAQVAKFRRQLFSWFGAIAVIMLLSIAFLLRGMLRPLRQIEAEIAAIEEGARASLSDRYPSELQGVARNMNLLIGSERARSERYRVTLGNLAHSLKTPLAAIRALLEEREQPEFERRANEQIDRMDEIVRYQLRKPAATANESPALVRVDIAAEVQRLVNGLRKVHHVKSPRIEVEVDPRARLRGDVGDLHELAGNLIDNACKWCKSGVRVSVAAVSAEDSRAAGMVLRVEDDGPGVSSDDAGVLLQRGTRLDESTPGHGIGLAIVRDIVLSYGGDITIGRSPLGGAEITVTIP
ncbi:MAG: ATP-binding protein [Gammaproteobacteria bacterium]|nr:ATP-binding protein [Gammaproteobacteria bacterium]MDH5304142.1 ATP-binding protein [Gammaproteobacteria bacterium]MDH5321847.1 ATP-binding protein [Gammaproteobacteria bacterium]